MDEEECNAPAAALLLRLTAATLDMLRSVDLIDSLPAPPAPSPSGDGDGAARITALAAQAAGAAWEDARSAGAATLPNRAAQLFAALADALERAAWVMDVADLDDVQKRAGGERDLWAAVALHARARLRQASADLRVCASGGPAAHVVAALADDLERLANGGAHERPDRRPARRRHRADGGGAGAADRPDRAARRRSDRPPRAGVAEGDVRARCRAACDGAGRAGRMDGADRSRVRRGGVAALTPPHPDAVH
jgi:hypothetical protein